MPHDDIYLGNPLLKKANVDIQFTPDQIKEFIKCKDDPVYFANNYIKIVSVDEGLIPFEIYPFQEKLIKNFHSHRFNICKMPRQSGKSTTVVSYLLHYVVFNDNVNVGILANKASTAKDLLGRLQKSYENLPKWMQQGVQVWNKASLELENGSKIIAASTSASAVRGMSFNIIFLDEFAFIPNHIADEFFSSVYPTISSGKTTKVIIVSTPKGMNHFYRLWHNAERGRNEYIPTEVHWSEVPGRDAVWKAQTISNTSEQQFQQEFECDFLGSSDTLISSAKLKSLIFEDPIQKNKGLDVYFNPIEDRSYFITVDVARGTENDYSAFIVFDITEFPWRVVAKYKNNQIKPMLFPSIISDVAKAYNQSYILVEINDIGEQVANILHFDLEYENVLPSLHELLQESQPIIIRGVPIPPILNSLKLAEIPRLNSFPLSANASYTLQTYRTHPELVFPDEQAIGLPILEPIVGRTLAKELSIDTWMKYTYNDFILELSGYFSVLKSIKTSVVLGGCGMVRPRSLYTCIIPTEGTYIVSLVNKRSENFLPKTAWTYKYPSILSVNDTPLVGEIQFIDIIARPGTMVIIPCHCIYSMTPKEMGKFHSAVLLELDSPISNMATLFLG